MYQAYYRLFVSSDLDILGTTRERVAGFLLGERNSVHGGFGTGDKLLHLPLEIGVRMGSEWSRSNQWNNSGGHEHIGLAFCLFQFNTWSLTPQTVSQTWSMYEYGIGRWPVPGLNGSGLTEYVLVNLCLYCSSVDSWIILVCFLRHEQLPTYVRKAST